MNRIVAKTISLAMSIVALFSTIVSAEPEEKDFTPEFVAECKAKAIAGDAEGQSLYGQALLYGWGIASNHVMAVKWLTMAANKGNPIAQCDLGYCYESGRGVDKDMAKAVSLFHKSATQGYAVAQVILGICFMEGDGVKKDCAQGVEWFRKAAMQDDVLALYNLGKCFRDGVGVKKDEKKAIKCFRKAATLGFDSASNCLINLELGIYDNVSVSAILADYETADNALNHLSKPPAPLANECLWDAMLSWKGTHYMEDAPTTWERINGDKVHGKWQTCDESGKIIRIYDEEGYRHLYVGTLCDRDRKFVEEKIMGFRNDHRYVWKDGFFVTRANLNGIEEAVKIIKTKSPVGRQHVKIFQVTGGNTALAYNGSLNKYGTYELRQLVRLIGNDVGRLYAEEEERDFDKLYWASTYTYETKRGDTKTIPQLSTDFSRAVLVVRESFNLYDETDPVLGTFSTSSSEAIGGEVPPHKEQKRSNQDKKTCVSAFGSGFFVSHNGFFLTNYHVVKNSANFEILFKGKTYVAKCFDYDPDLDIALLKIDEGAFPFLTFTCKRTATLGEDVYAIGYPRPTLQGTSVKVTKGVISGLRGIMDDPHCYQIDASIQPGNSGGPIVDAYGNVVGMAVATLKNTDTMMDNGVIAQNVNYAIKNSFILAFLDSSPECKYTISDETEKTQGTSNQNQEKATEACGLVIVYE